MNNRHCFAQDCALSSLICWRRMISSCIKYCTFTFWLFFYDSPQNLLPDNCCFISFQGISQKLTNTFSPSNTWRVSEREWVKRGGHSRAASREQCCCTAFLVTDQFLCWLFVLTMKSRRSNSTVSCPPITTPGQEKHLLNLTWLSSQFVPVVNNYRNKK